MSREVLSPEDIKNVSSACFASEEILAICGLSSWWDVLACLAKYHGYSLVHHEKVYWWALILMDGKKVLAKSENATGFNVAAKEILMEINFGFDHSNT